MHLDEGTNDEVISYWCNIQIETWIDGLTGIRWLTGQVYLALGVMYTVPVKFLDDSDHSIIHNAKGGQSVRETFLHYQSPSEMQEE